ncbi:tetratricopeptide repeat protein [Hyphomonas sp.]|uniref:tetratricopeptide repeat protein n=1 Tax=Hyphomonas sp. TaxID=87 RepID=UPI00391DDFB2
MSLPMILRLFLLPILMATLLLGGCASRGFPGSAYDLWGDDRPAEASTYRDFMIARLASMSNDPQSAARRYAAVIDRVPEPAGIAERAVFSALLAGEYGTAAGLARRADAAGSEAGLVRLTLATDAIVRGRPQQAVPYLDETRFMAFNRNIARGMAAWTALDRQGIAAAEALIEPGLTGDVRFDSPALYQLALLRIAAREDDKALETLERIWDSGARLAIGVEAHAELLAARGERERALELLTRFRNEVGANTSVTALAARIEAGQRIQPRRLTLRQGAARAVYVSAAALMYQTEDDLSSVYFVLALALDPDLDVARTLWAQALDNANRYDDAIRVLQAVRPASAYYANARGQMAGVLHRAGRSEEALQVAAVAIAGNPDRMLKLQLADLYIGLERFADAEAVLTEVYEADAVAGREDWRILFSRGAARERQGNWPEAEADLIRALELRPDSATVLNYLGYSWIDRGENLEEGFELIRRAVMLEPNSGHIVDSLGWAYFRLGEYETAVDYLERAVELLPGDPILNDHLGDAYWKAGRRLEAGFQWRRALRLDPTEADRKKIEIKLGSPLGPDAPELQAPAS